MEVSSWKKNIYFYGPFSTAMFNNQRVYINITTWEIHKNTHTHTYRIPTIRPSLLGYPTDLSYSDVPPNKCQLPSYLGHWKGSAQVLGRPVASNIECVHKNMSWLQDRMMLGLKEKNHLHSIMLPNFCQGRISIGLSEDFPYGSWPVWEVYPMSKHAQVQEQKLAWKVWPSWVTPTTQYMYRIDM